MPRGSPLNAVKCKQRPLVHEPRTTLPAQHDFIDRGNYINTDYPSSAYDEIQKTQRRSLNNNHNISLFAAALVSLPKCKTNISLNLNRLHHNPSEWKLTHQCSRFMHLRVSFVRPVGNIVIYNRFAKRMALVTQKGGLAKHAKNIIFVGFFPLFFLLLHPKIHFLKQKSFGFFNKSLHVDPSITKWKV